MKNSLEIAKFCAMFYTKICLYLYNFIIIVMIKFSHLSTISCSIPKVIMVFKIYILIYLNFYDLFSYLQVLSTNLHQHNFPQKLLVISKLTGKKIILLFVLYQCGKSCQIKY